MCKTDIRLRFRNYWLIALSPLFLIVSIAIRLDSPGPIFFRNTRHGFNNDKIRVFQVQVDDFN